MEQTYCGTELELFKRAKNWKAYLKKEITPHLDGDILEVGAGLGINFKVFSSNNSKIQSWTCIEPDSNLANRIEITSSPPMEVFIGTLTSIQTNKKFDTAIYIDVLEHIEKDHSELINLLSYLKPGGKLIIISPAHQFLYSKFDEKIGHFRRYNKKSLQSIVPSDFVLITIDYLDSAGFLLSIINRFIFNTSIPSILQILLWDKILVRISKFTDVLLNKKIGKSIIGVWEKRK